MTAVQGALGGFAATVPMTLTMEGMKYGLNLKQRLPPKKVAERILEKAELDTRVPQSGKKIFTWISHFGFGATAGAAYAVAMPSPAKQPILKGMAFGMGVWAVSYAGWIPGAGLMRYPSEESKRYLALEIVSHLVWGACLGGLTARRHANISKRQVG